MNRIPRRFFRQSLKYTPSSRCRKRNGCDDEPMESSPSPRKASVVGIIFGTLKTESLHHYRFATREQARQVVFEYIEELYNRIRRHAKNGIQVPAEFTNRLYANNTIAA